MSAPVLQLAGITKSFGGTRALVNGELQLAAGQVTALLGENGAGKSTLVKILTGVHQPDGGEIRVDGSIVRIGSPQDAQKLGISVIHQESVTFDDLTVAENVFIGAAPRRRGLIAWRDMRRHAAALLAQLDAPLDPDTPLRELSVAQKHLVQIARALCHEARTLIMDEPTAALSKNEADDLLQIVRRLREAGHAVLYISHKFEEVFALADRYAVFRDGAAVGAGAIADTNHDELVRLMVGRTLAQTGSRATAAPGAELLRVENLGRDSEYADVSLRVHAGEILGIYGLVGAGRSELMRSLFGITQPDSGRMFLAGRECRFASPGAASAAGLAYVPEDRQAQGVVLSQSIADNIVLPSLARFVRGVLLPRSPRHTAASDWASRLQVKCRDVDQSVQDLSGGNQQKVVLAKWLLTAPRVLILDEPSKGIDIAAKAAVHALIAQLAAQGLAVIIVSSELPEILAMSDRILVMRRGRVGGSFERGSAVAEDILRAATDA